MIRGRYLIILFSIECFVNLVCSFFSFFFSLFLGENISTIVNDHHSANDYFAIITYITPKL